MLSREEHKKKKKKAKVIRDLTPKRLFRLVLHGRIVVAEAHLTPATLVIRRFCRGLSQFRSHIVFPTFVVDPDTDPAKRILKIAGQVYTYYMICKYTCSLYYKIIP